MSTPHMLLPITHMVEVPGWVGVTVTVEPMTEDERRERNAERQRRVRARKRAEAGLVSDPVPMPVWPEAACRGSGLDWFPSHHDLRAEAAAVNVCRTCPHQVECLAWAIEHDERGIWGGTTDRERLRAKIRGKRPIRHGTEAGAVEHRRQGIPACDECATARLAAERARRARRQAQ